MAATMVEGPALALDDFEIQVYDGTANAPGVPGVELHLNMWPDRGKAFHATLEPSLGVLPFLELGAYLQGAMQDGAIDWAGAKLRAKLVTPPGTAGLWRFGLNLEIASLPQAYDPARWSVEARPIVAWSDGAWLVAFNPILDQALTRPLTGPDRSSGPSFEPSLKVNRALGFLAPGLEYYASFGPVGALLPLRQEEHYLYETVDLTSTDPRCPPPLELEIGVGEGLTPASAGIVFKAILGYTFESSHDARRW